MATQKEIDFILEMLAEGKITIDQADMLLNSLVGIYPSAEQETTLSEIPNQPTPSLRIIKEVI